MTERQSTKAGNAAHADCGHDRRGTALDSVRGRGLERTVKHAAWSLGWKSVGQIAVDRGYAVEIGYNPAELRPYCVHFGGNGNYFETLGDAVVYCCGRDWLCDIVHRSGKPGPGWKRREPVSMRKGRRVWIYHNPGAELSFCVVKGGRSYYFKTITAARSYCFGRRWLRSSDSIYMEERT